MGDAVGLIGLYFTLIGFISGLFFTRIDSWYGSVRSFHGSLASLEERSEYRSAKTQVLGLQASRPVGSFVAVGALLSALTVLSFFVPLERSAVDPLLFIHLPLLATVGAYWLGGTVFLLKGHSRLVEAEGEIDEGLRG
jgi:hypothetical protein